MIAWDRSGGTVPERKPQQLLPGERTIASNELITLTNYRVFRDAGGSGQTRYVSITLDAISSCGLVTSSQPALLALGAIAVVAGFALQKEAQVAAFVGGVFCIILYLATRRAVFAICSMGGEQITLPARPDQRDALLMLLNAIDREKLAGLGRIGTGQPMSSVASAPPQLPPRLGSQPVGRL